MKDAISVQRILLLHPIFRDQVTSFIEALELSTGLVWRIVEGFRSFAEQTAIYNQGRTTPGKIVTWAPAGTSFHNYGVAIDTIPFFPGSTTELNWKYNLKAIEPLAVAHGMECGMDWPEPKTDSDHFENRYGMDWQDMYHKYTIKDFISGTQFINIP